MNPHSRSSHSPGTVLLLILQKNHYVTILPDKKATRFRIPLMDFDNRIPNPALTGQIVLMTA